MLYVPPEYRNGNSLVASLQDTLPRWYALDYHPVQSKLWRTNARFSIAAAGRRSGKTEIAKRKGVLKAITFTRFPDGRFVFAAPTLPQAKQIFWSDLKQLVPKWALSYVKKDPIRESDLTIWLWNGAHIQVLGMDKPERVEGSPLDFIDLDEYANMKEQVWTHHVRPALSTRGRPGEAMFTGVPEGRNHYFKLSMKARSLQNELWQFFTWHSKDILSAEEIESAREELDPLVFAQEYEGDFVSFEGLIYYNFDRARHCREPLKDAYYNSAAPLLVSLDFNVDPGVATISQECNYVGRQGHVGREFTAVLGEVYIEKNSTTPAVCRKLIQDWGDHKGMVYLYGDASGGNRGTAKIAGSDWEIVKDHLYPVFRDRLVFRVKRSNPAERARVNAVNSRLKSSKNVTRMLIDPDCEHLIDDFEGVVGLVGGSGEIDKKKDAKLTHISDALGYQIDYDHPVAHRAFSIQSI